jgi:hypothetical protein
MTVFVDAVIRLIKDVLKPQENTLASQSQGVWGYLYKAPLSIAQDDIIVNLTDTLTRFQPSNNDEQDIIRISELIQTASASIKIARDQHHQTGSGTTKGILDSLCVNLMAFHKKLLEYPFSLLDIKNPSYPRYTTPELIFYATACYYLGHEILVPSERGDPSIRAAKEGKLNTRLEQLFRLMTTELSLKEKTDITNQVIVDLLRDNQDVVQVAARSVSVSLMSMVTLSSNDVFGRSKGRMAQFFEHAAFKIRQLGPESRAPQQQPPGHRIDLGAPTTALGTPLVASQQRQSAEQSVVAALLANSGVLQQPGRRGSVGSEAKVGEADKDGADLSRSESATLQ